MADLTYRLTYTLHTDHSRSTLGLTRLKKKRVSDDITSRIYHDDNDANDSSTWTIDVFQPKVISDENGVKTIVVYRDNEDGKRVKVSDELGT